MEPKPRFLTTLVVLGAFLALSPGIAPSVQGANQPTRSELVPLAQDALTANRTENVSIIEHTFGFEDTATYRDLFISVQYNTKQQKDSFFGAEWKDHFGTKRHVDFSSFENIKQNVDNGGQFFWDNELQTVVVGTQQKDDMGFPVFFSPNDPNPDTKVTKIFYNPMIQEWDRQYALLDKAQSIYSFNFVIGQFAEIAPWAK